MESQARVADKHLLIINSIFIVIEESCYQERLYGGRQWLLFGYLEMWRKISQAGCRPMFNKLPGLTQVYSPFSLRFLEWILLARNVSADWGRLILCYLILCQSCHILALFFPFGFYTSYIFAFFFFIFPTECLNNCFPPQQPSICNLLLIFVAFLQTFIHPFASTHHLFWNSEQKLCSMT